VHFLRIFRSKQREFLRFRCRIVAFQLINRALLTEAFPFVCVVFVLLEEFLEKRQARSKAARLGMQISFISLSYGVPGRYS
jgi:hypothetical protein